MKASENPFPKITVVEELAPSSPASGRQALFIDSSDHHLKRVNSTGTVVDVEIAAGNYTVNDALTTTTNTGLLANVVSWLAGMIKQITGKAHWYDAPDTTLAGAHTHAIDTTNPHSVTALQAGALVSVDGVSNPGGNIDLIAGANITITPDDAANTITIAAASSSSIATINGVSPDGAGNFTLFAGSNITLTPATNQITIASSGGGGGGGGGGGPILLSSAVGLGRWNQGDTTAHAIDVSSYIDASATSVLVMVAWFENGNGFVLWPGNASTPGIAINSIPHPVDRVAGTTYPGVFILSEKSYMTTHVWVGVDSGHISIAPWGDSWKRYYIELLGYSL